MRLVRLKISAGIKVLLGDYSRQYVMPDKGILEDLYALLRYRGGGLPSVERLRKMADSFPPMQRTPMFYLMSKRRMMLNKLASSSVFLHATADPSPINGVVRLLAVFRSFYSKVQSVRCHTCALKPACAFGQEHGNSVDSPKKIWVATELTKVHPQCPIPPDVSGVQLLEDAVTLWQQLLTTMSEDSIHKANEREARELMENSEPDDDLAKTLQDEMDRDPQEAGVSFLAGITAKDTATYIGPGDNYPSESLVASMSKEQLAIFVLGTEFSRLLGLTDSPKFTPVEQTADEKETDAIRNAADLPRLVPSQHGLPEAVQEAREANLSLTRRTYADAAQRKRILYVLLDVSGSMRSLITGMTSSPFSLFTRSALAAAFTLSLVQKVVSEKGLFFLRFFEQYPGPLLAATDPASCETLTQQIRSASFNGGGTDISAAVMAAIVDIRRVESTTPLASATLLLITDGCSYGDKATLLKALSPDNKRLRPVQLNTLDVTPGAGSRANVWRQVSTKYYQTNAAASKLADIVQLCSHQLPATPSLTNSANN